eukprot:3290492-Pyramimonas_sp.AAC.1
MHNAEEGVGRAPGNPHAGLGREASASSAAPKAAAAGHAAPAVPGSSGEMDSIKECLQRLTAAQMQQQNQEEAVNAIQILIPRFSVWRVRPFR